MSKILLLSGTDRPNSYALRVTRFVAKEYEKLGAQTEILNLEDYPFSAVLGGTYDPKIPEIQVFNNKLMQAEAIVFIVPEYNGSFPGALKLMLDYLPFPHALKHKPIALIGEASGAFGSLRAVEQFQLVLNYRNAFCYPDRVFIQRITKNFTDEDGPTDAVTASLLKEQMKGFLAFIGNR